MGHRYVDEQLPCGCQVCIDGTGVSYLVQCPLHKAAPDLLAACKAWMNWIKGGDLSHEDIIEQTRTAIAKAKGDQCTV